MSIRTKTLFLIGLVLAISTIVLHQFISAQQLRSYKAIELESAQRDVNRVAAVMVREIYDYGYTTSDYGSWNDTYEFSVNLNSEYAEENFNPSHVFERSMNYVILVDMMGELLFGIGVNLKSGKVHEVPAELLEQLAPDGPFLSQQEGVIDVGGFLSVDDKILLTSAAPILKNDDSGPQRGFLIMARYLDYKKSKELKAQTQLNFISVTRKSDGFPDRVNPTIDKMLAMERSEEFATETPLTMLEYVDEQTINGQILFADPAGEPVLLMTVNIPRNIYLAGKASLKILLGALTGAGVVLILVLLILLDRIVLRRLSRLGTEVSVIGETSDLGARVDASGHDEFSQVGQAINWMLEQLELSNEKLAEEHARAEGLLLNILPAQIAEKLKTNPESIAQSYDEVSILFADLVGFTKMASTMSADEIVEMLNGLFSKFDVLAMDIGLEKIKTIGDAYMVVAGLPEPNTNHANALATMALGMVQITQDFGKKHGLDLSLRIGINTGVVVAGVIGKNKFIYDLWGDAVNLASRMESTGVAGAIQITKASKDFLSDEFVVEERGQIEVKGRGKMTTFFLKSGPNGP